jgi:hypothetical protein
MAFVCLLKKGSPDWTPQPCQRAYPRANRKRAKLQREIQSAVSGKTQSGKTAAVVREEDRSLSRVDGGNPVWITGCELFTQRADSGSRTRDGQLIGLLLYPLSYIQVGAEGSDDRRHAVLQWSRASEAV